MVPKFRAWNMPFGPKGPMQEMVYGKASSILAFAEMSPDKYIVEQSAGLKDANGKEIYKGDIVKVIYKGNEDYEGPARVVFDNGAVRLEGKIMKKIYVDILLFESYSDPTDNLLCNYHTQVIGNVHENPELLEAQHD